MRSLAEIYPEGLEIERAEAARLAAVRASQPRRKSVLDGAPGWRVPAAKPAAGPKPANDNTPKTSPSKPRFTTTWFRDIGQAQPKNHVIRGVFGVGEFSVLSGLPGSGKSVIVTDAACHVAAGMEWQGRQVKRGLVVFIAAERRPLTERRMIAFRKQHGIDGLPLLIVGNRPNFTASTADAEALVQVIEAASREVSLPPVWIIVDTLTRSFGGGDQNTSKDMVRFITSCDILAEKTGAHVTVIHHTGHSGERAKGAIDLDGAVDSSFLVKKDGASYVLECDGTNDGDEGLICRFGMQSVVVGVDDDGLETTAPVVVSAPATMAEKLINSASRHEAAVLDALRCAVGEDGVEPEGQHFPDDVVVVTEAQWRAAYYAADTDGTKAHTLIKRFARAKQSLIEGGSVVQVGQWYWNAE